MSDRPPTLADRLGEKALVAFDLLLAVGALALSVAVPRALDLPPWLVVCSLLGTVLLLWAADGARTRPVTTFGTRREVEYAAARDERCDECGDPAVERRRFAERTFAFGVPLTTGDWGVNAYCESCREGPPAEDGPGGADPDRDRERTTESA